MLAGSIAASKLVGTDITTVGTITSGVWQGTVIADSYISSASTWNGKQSALSGTGIVKSVSGTILYLTDNSGNWNTAYGWGNWASNFGSSAGTIAQGNDSRINNGQTAYSWGNPSGVYLPLAAGSGSPLTGDLYINSRGIQIGSSSLPYIQLTNNNTTTDVYSLNASINSSFSGYGRYFGFNAPSGTGFLFNQAVTLQGALSGTSASFTSSSDNTMALYRTQNTTAYGVSLGHYLNNSSNAQTEYAFSAGYIITNTAGAENGGWTVYTRNAGTLTQQLSITNTGAATFASSVTATSFYESSSILKKNVFNRQVSSDGIDIVGFTWKPEFNIDKKNHIGVIAQEVEKILPDAVEGDTEVSKRVNYTEVLLYKIAELEKRIKALENK